MKKPYTTLFLIGALMGGCASDMENMRDNHKAETSQNVISQDIPLDKDIPLTLSQAWPVLYNHMEQGTYLQKINTKALNKDFTITVHLSINNHKIEFIALHDIYGRIYHLVWTPHDLTWEASDHLPDTVRPENIILDFLLVHLPHKDLADFLKKQNGKIQVKGTHAADKERRLIKEGDNVLRDIKMEWQQGIFWKTVTLRNPQYDYTLNIETVRLAG